MTETTESPARRPVWPFLLGVVGIGAHVVVGYFYLVAGLVTPVYGLIVFWIVWAALFVVALRMLRRHPLRILPIPLAAFGILLGGMSLGGAVLGWSA